MEGGAVTQRQRSNDEAGIPLFLLPLAISRHIRRMGRDVYRISVKRTHLHYYNISIRTKPVPRELMPGRILLGDRQAVREMENQAGPEMHRHDIVNGGVP